MQGQQRKLRGSQLYNGVFALTVLFSFSRFVADIKYLQSLEKNQTSIVKKRNSITIVNSEGLSSYQYINSTDSNNTSSDEDKQDDEFLDESFDEYWPYIKQGICPNMIPNPRVWQTIFDLARAEMNFAQTTVSKEPLFRDFFTFSFGGLGFINGNHSTVYLRIWKGGNDFIRKNLKYRIEEEYNQSVYESWDQTRLYKDMNIITRTPSSDSKVQDALTEKKTCIITALRDPISHFISAYNEVEFRHQKDPNEQRLPKNKGIPLLFTRFKPGSTERFQQFVADFLGGPRQYGWHSYVGKAELMHLYSMTGILYKQDLINHCYGSNLTLTAYIPSLSNLSSAFPKLLTKTCPVVPPGLDKQFNITETHPSQFSEYGFDKAGKKIWAQGGNIARSLCALHVLDYACFDLIAVPDICTV